MSDLKKELSPGILTLAIGAQDYLAQAYYLGLSLRRNMPDCPLAVVTDDRSGYLAEVFDHIVPARPALGRGVRQKMHLDEYSPFDETLFVDADCLASRPFPDELEAIRRFDFSPIVLRLLHPGDADEYIADLPGLMRREGVASIPKFNGGVYFFRKSEAAQRLFDLARRIHQNHGDYGLKAFDATGPGDEPAYALAMGVLNLPSYDDHGRLMRTPVGLRGGLRIDPLGGGCDFIREEGPVSPAICHFAGDYRFMPEYHDSRIALERGCRIEDIPLSLRLATRAGLAGQRLARRLRWFRGSVDKRLARLLAAAGLRSLKAPAIRR